MGDTPIVDVRALEPGEGEIAAWARGCGRMIVETGPADREPGDALKTIDGGCRLLTPGLIDIHTRQIAERPTPAEPGGYVFDLRDTFHKVVAAAGGDGVPPRGLPCLRWETRRRAVP